ncbi:GIY-YIG nuclease family protein [Streptomyces ambofaciens]
MQDYQPGETYTYLIGAEGSDLVKIGYAKDPDKRVMFLQTGSPMRLSILWAERGSYEAALHAEFREVLAHGEWFNLTALGDPVALVTEAVARIKAAQ